MYLIILYNLFGFFLFSTGIYTTFSLHTYLYSSNTFNNIFIDIFCGIILFLTITLSSFGFCMGYIAYKGRKK